MKILLIQIAVLLFACTLKAQDITQIVKGNVTDHATASPLAKATIQIQKETDIETAQTDDNGNFSMTMPVGRYKIFISYTGYQPVQQELLVIAGRESVVNIGLTQSIRQLEEVEVTSSPLLPELPGLRSISIEKTLRIPANFFDPIRAVTAYPGVVAANDQNNSIIVRGNSPNGLLWRLNGLDIVNPNHLANAGTLSDMPAANGGGVNILSAQMLDRTDIYMGAFPANYGNALSGIIDMKLREGNKNKLEYTAQPSLIGLDFSAEGPIGEKQNTSFLANFRYSTVGLLSAIGINLGDEVITFQDISFHLNSDLKNNGKFSFFGLWGNNINDFDHKKPEEVEEDKDWYDINYESSTFATGINYQTPLFKGKLFAGLAYSGNYQDRDALISMVAPLDERFLISNVHAFNSELLSGNLKYETSISKRSTLEIGMMTNFISNEFESVKNFGCINCSSRTIRDLSGVGEGFLFQPFSNLSIALTNAISLQMGARYLQYTYNNTNSVEPRVQVSIKPSVNTAIDLSYSLVSQLQLPQVYATSGNKDIDFTKSHHVDLGYSVAFENDLHLKSGVFYQQMFNVPIEGNDGSTFSTLNLMEGDVPVDLVNEGTGENYGVDLTLEKMFFNKNYFLVGGSYYESKYKGGDNILRDTRFNGNYTFTGVYGKEWTNPEKNRTIGLNTRVLYLGGLRANPVNVGESFLNGETLYDPSGGYSEKLNDYFRLDLRLSFRKNKPGYTRTFAIDIQNLTGQENEAYQYYDFYQAKIVTKFQLGIIPILVYRIDF